MNVLVTGALGFVGRHFSAPAKSRARLVGLLESSSEGPDGAGWAQLLAADLRDFDALRQVFRQVRPDWVVHLAGQSSAGLSFERPRETFQVNTAGTINLLEAVRAECPDARVLVVGTSECYGPQTEGSRASEDTPMRPVSPYALSKAAADVAAQSYARAHGLSVLRTRSFAHVGPGQSPRFAIPGFAKQVAEAEAGLAEPILRVGNLEVTRDLTDVRDVVEAYWRLCERGRAGEAYNVCSGQGVVLAQVAQTLVRQARVPIRIEADAARMRPADVPYLVGDPSRIEHDTGWHAAIPLEQSLREVLEEWRSRVATGVVPDS